METVLSRAGSLGNSYVAVTSAVANPCHSSILYTSIYIKTLSISCQERQLISFLLRKVTICLAVLMLSNPVTVNDTYAMCNPGTGYHTLKLS